MPMRSTVSSSVRPLKCFITQMLMTRISIASAERKGGKRQPRRMFHKREKTEKLIKILLWVGLRYSNPLTKI